MLIDAPNNMLIYKKMWIYSSIRQKNAFSAMGEEITLKLYKITSMER